MLDLLRRWFGRLFGRDAVIEPVSERVSERVRARRGSGSSGGSARLRADILDRLDELFSAARLMRRSYPDDYAFFSRVGLRVFGGGARLLWAPSGDRMSRFSYDPATRLSFGSLMFKSEPDDEKYSPLLITFSRVSAAPWHVERTNHDLYRVCVYYDERRMLPCVAYCAVSRVGEVRVLRERYQEMQHIPDSHNRSGQSIAHRRFDYPIWLRGADAKDRVSPENLARMFQGVYTLNAEATDDVTVRVRKGGVVAAFAVDLLKLPGFFQDRDFVAGETGRRKRIFHIVRTHYRHQGDRRSVVRSHFRGARKFVWNGYHASIVVPETHHPSLSPADIGEYYIDHDERLLAGFLESETAGAMIDRALSR